MPTYRVKAPNGKLYDIEMPTFGTEQDAIDYVNRAFPAPSQAGFFQAFKEGFQTAGDIPEAASFAGASKATEDERRKALLAARESPYAYTSVEDIRDVSSGIDWLLQNAGRSLGFVAGPGLAGAAATAMKGPGAGRAVGAGLLGLQYVTENLARQAGEQEQAIQEGKAPDPTSVGRAVLAAAGSTALDVYQAKLFAPLYRKFPGMAKMLGEEGEEATKEATEQLVTAFRNNTLKMSNGIATAAVRGSVLEVPQEIAQQALERWQAGLSLTDDNARQEYIEAAAGAVALGSGMGAASQYFKNAGDYAKAESLDRADRERIVQEQQLARKEERKTSAIAAQGMTDADKLANIDAFVRTQPPTGKEDLKAAIKAAFPGLVRDSKDAGINLDTLIKAGVLVKGADGRLSVSPNAPPLVPPTKPYVKPEAPGTTAPADTTTPTPPGTTAPADTTTPAGTATPNIDPRNPNNLPTSPPPEGGTWFDPSTGTTENFAFSSQRKGGTDTNLAERIEGSQTPVEKPRVDSIPRLHIGMGVFNTSVVAEGNPLYRETSVAKLSDSLGLPHQFTHFPSFVTDDETLALGQGDNKGVLVKYRPNSVSGEEHRKPGTGIIGGREYRTNVLAPDPVESITFRNPADIRKLDGVSAFRINRNFSRTANPDGSVTYTRKPTGVAPSAQEGQAAAPAGGVEGRGAGAGPALPLQQAAATEAGQAQAPERGGVDTTVARDERLDEGEESVPTPLTQHIADVSREVGANNENVNAISLVARVLQRAKMLFSSDNNVNATDDIRTLVDNFDPGNDKEAAENKRSLSEQIAANGKANTRRLVKMFGPAFYGDPSNVCAITLKETLQNSFDAIKSVMRTDPNFKGKIDISEDYSGYGMTITDNGIGMSPELMGGKFLEIAGTDKENEGDETSGNSGGLGMAKMLFLYGNKQINVISLKDGVYSQMSFRGVDLFNSLDPEHTDYAPLTINTFKKGEYDQGYTDEIGKLFPDGHGTSLNIESDRNFIDPQTGVEKAIMIYPSKTSATALTNSPLFRNIDVTFIDHNVPNSSSVRLPENRDNNLLPIGAHFPANYRPFFTVGFPWGNMRVYVGDYDENTPHHNVSVLSNGLYQFSKTMYVNPVLFSKVIPYKFYFDIEPKVKPSSAGYPFFYNRMGFMPQAEEDFVRVYNYIAKTFVVKDYAKGAKSFGEVTYIGKKDDGNIGVTKTLNITPDIPTLDNTGFAPLNPGDTVESRDGKIFVNGREQTPVTPQQIANAVPNLGDLVLDQSKIDPNSVMVHDNTQVTNHVNGTTTPLLQHMRELFGKEKVNEFLFDVGDTFMQLRNLVAAVMPPNPNNGRNYEGLLKEAIGISIDPYRGVSIRIPFAGSFVNPFIPQAERNGDPRRALGIFGTMIHELTHHTEREDNHGPTFAAEMQRIRDNLDAIFYDNVASDPEKARVFTDLQEKFVRTMSDPAYQRMIDVFQDYFNTTKREKNAATKSVSLSSRQKSFDSQSAYEQIPPGGSGDSTSGNAAPTGGTGGQQSANAGATAGAQTTQAGGQSGSAAEKAGRKGSVKGKKNVRKRRAGVVREVTADDAQNNLVREMTTPDRPSLRATITKAFSSFAGYETAVRKGQNSRRPIKTLEDAMEWAGTLIVTGKGYNNLYTQLTLSTGRAFNALNLYLTAPMNELDGLVVEYSKKSGMPINDALARLHVYMMGLHEPERRAVKYLYNVPLENDDTKKNYQLKGIDGTALENVRDTPHELRMAVLRELYRDVDLHSDYDANGKSTAMKYRAALEDLVENHKSNAVGKSGTSMRDVDASTLSLDINAPEYNVIGMYSTDSIKGFKDAYDSDPNKDIVDKITEKMQEIGKTTTDLSRKANYWTPPVDNITAFYNWNYYVPFKGKGASYVSEGDERFELRGKAMGGGMTEFAMEFGGRESDSDNPILQVKVDAIKAAMRFGRHGTSKALKNLIVSKHIKGRPFKTIKFEDRYNGLSADEREALKGENLFYHYLKDGTIKIYRITDPEMRESIRQSYTEPNPVLSMLGQVTTFMGHTHTRWNPAFHPYNFIRDILTNSFAFAADFGPAKAYQLIESVTSTVMNKGGFRKSALVSRMYGEGKVKELQEMAKDDVFIRDLLEYLEEGGKVSYIMGLSNKSQLQQLLDDIDQNGFAKTQNVLTKYLDIWGDIFELSSRAAAYSAVKSTYRAEGLSEAAARTKAASYVKNLANFESVGEWGQNLGALFMFFRPAATGAVRALDSIKTVFFSADDMLAQMPAKMRNNPRAVENFKKRHAQQRARAIKLMSTLTAAGAAIFTMALIAADDDDAGRNVVATDDMSLWTRNIRLPMKMLGEDKFLQIPWGFGLGAFAAAGAQIAGAAFGTSGLKDIAPNFVTLALDSYVPVPVARIDPRDNPGLWLLDSVTPSVGRPILEFVANTDALGREIYNNRLTKYGDPYIAGKNVPELYREITMGLAELTNGRIQWQPSTVQFVASNFADGFARMAVNFHGLTMYATEKSTFNPKTDLSLLSSFIGQKSNYDAREFAELENKMKEYKQTYSMFERDPKQLQRWLQDHPNMDIALYVFNQGINGQLRQLRAEYNQLLGSRVRHADGTDLTPAERKYYVEENLKAQNQVKRDFILMMEQYKID